MATSTSTKACQIENACKRDAQALCFHCSRNLCSTHLLQHVQLVEEMTRTELNLLADKFNELSTKFNDISVSANILDKPFDELEKWRVKAYEKIDQIVALKRAEINKKIEEYQRVFATKNNEQKKKMNESKKLIVELSQEADVSRKQMNHLQTLINETEKYLQSLTMHKINVSNALPLCYVGLDTHFFDCQPLSNDKIREFQITYVRLNGNIRNYDVKTKKHGTMADLISSFVIKYNLLEQLEQMSINSNCMNDYQLKSDYILPAEVYNHRIRLQYNDETQLTNILDKDMIVFYEIPYSLKMLDSPRILMPCRFRRLPDKKPFALPIYLNVPRKECRGRDVRDPLKDSLDKFFPMSRNIHRNWYNTTLVLITATPHHQMRKALSDALDDQLDFAKTNTSLEVAIDNEIAIKYENEKIKYGYFH